jgi:hypothetical protein
MKDRTNKVALATANSSSIVKGSHLQRSLTINNQNIPAGCELYNMAQSINVDQELTHIQSPTS